ncbi:hypothetical protein [Bacillus sp. 7884-1]|uniref:hypothetical protein n=1 Tax=Bacillus sp. 7884-1 TaxID=2021693 RepID=UPI0015CC4F75|nr:hypothetical protein [Bacillus sp. 7884-1]
MHLIRVLPIVLIVGEGVPYSIQSKYIRILLAKTFYEFMKQFQQKVAEPIIIGAESLE